MASEDSAQRVVLAQRCFIAMVSKIRSDALRFPPAVLSLDELGERDDDSGVRDEYESALAQEEPDFARTEVEEDLNAFLAHLPDDDRGVVYLMIGAEGLRAADVARGRGCSPVKVHRQLRRIAKRWRTGAASGVAA